MRLMKTLIQGVNRYKYPLVAFFALLGSSGLLYYAYKTLSSPIQTTILKAPPTEIKGSYITLKPLTEDIFIDYHNMFSNTVRKALEFPEVITLGYTIRYLQEEQKKAKNDKMLMYCIFDNKENKLIGSIEIREKNDTDPGQLGCWINESYWGGNRIQEALKLITDTYFKLHPEVQHYIAHVRLWNKRSYKALLKFGLKEIGYFYENGKATRYILEMKRPNR